MVILSKYEREKLDNRKQEILRQLEIEQDNEKKSPPAKDPGFLQTALPHKSLRLKKTAASACPLKAEEGMFFWHPAATIPQGEPPFRPPVFSLRKEAPDAPDAGRQNSPMQKDTRQEGFPRPCSKLSCSKENPPALHNRNLVLLIHSDRSAPEDSSVRPGLNDK